MAEIVLRVRLIGGEHLDVTYQQDEGTLDEATDRVISALAEDSGLLRCRHGGRLIVLYARGVATVEVAPRGAVLLRPGRAGAGAGHASGSRVFPRVGLPLLTALVLDNRGDVPDAYLERERINLVQAAQRLHDVLHVPHRLLRQALNPHEPAGTGLGETRNGTRLDPVKVTHDRPPSHETSG
jgi:hypothetical protein